MNSHRHPRGLARLISLGLSGGILCAPLTLHAQDAPPPAGDAAAAAPPAAAPPAPVAAPPATPLPAPPAAAPPPAPNLEAGVAPPPDDKPAEPFAFGDFTWLEGNSRQHKSVLDTPYFTPEILFDVNYTSSLNHPIDNTVVGSTALSRNQEFTLAFMGFGGDFHYENARGRIMTQFGVRSTLVPRNDFSTYRGQFDLQTALRYVSEAYGGYHFNALNGINLDAGIFMSYIGLFSYDNAENWMYLPSFTSDNTPWFFNGIRLQVFTSDKFKIEPWLINGWQSYGTFNERPGFGASLLWRPVDYVSFVSNNYMGWDVQDSPGRVRFHTDNSLQVKYFEAKTESAPVKRMAFTITGDFGGEHGDGATPWGGKGTEGNCTNATPCTQQFASWMAYDRTWLSDHLAFTFGGGMMHNPGRYLVLAPTGEASSLPAPTSLQGASYTAATKPYDQSLGSQFDAYDYEAGFQYMPDEQVTIGLEFNHRHASVPYFAGHGGVTSPDGYITTAVPAGWRPDLSQNDTRGIASLLVRF